tara:strand:- start:775 stop:1155 length:381 start_codon:yes stop_codon:yes gene_type:complete
MPNHYGAMSGAGKAASKAGQRIQRARAISNAGPGIFRGNAGGGNAISRTSKRRVSKVRSLPSSTVKNSHFKWNNGRTSKPRTVVNVNSNRVKPAKIVKYSSTRVRRHDGVYGTSSTIEHWCNGRNC